MHVCALFVSVCISMGSCTAIATCTLHIGGMAEAF